MNIGTDAAAGPLDGAHRHATPGIARRLACFVYEGVLLFGVLMITALLFGLLMQQRHAMQDRAGLMATLFVILAIYFTWFWSHGGQTVAMKTWHIRLVDVAGRPVTAARAFGRYLLCWMWFLPALATLYRFGLKSTSAIMVTVGVGALGYAALSWLRSDRQFWHDALCGTRLITWRPARPAQSAG